MIKNKIVSVFVVVTILFTIFSFSSSAAEKYTEFYEYNGQAISSADADVLSGIAINLLRRSPDRYRYWCSFRIDEYRYAIVWMSDYDSYTLDSKTYKATVTDCVVNIYNKRLYSTSNNGYNTSYQAGIEPVEYRGDIEVQFTRGYAIGNIPATINVHPEYESVLYFEYIKYILYTLVAFLLLFVAFKFLNKRWLLP